MMNPATTPAKAQRVLVLQGGGALGSYQALQHRFADMYIEFMESFTLLLRCAEALESRDEQQIERKPAGRIDLRAACTDRGREVADGTEQDLCFWSHGIPVAQILKIETAEISQPGRLASVVNWLAARPSSQPSRLRRCCDRPALREERAPACRRSCRRVRGARYCWWSAPQ